MKYNELKEMTIKEWDGVPFEAYVDDGSGELTIEEIVSYDGKYDEPWGTEQCNNYLHVYPVEWNKEKIEKSSKSQRMTNRQLSMWLAKGNGECSYNNTVYYLSAYGYHCYDMRHANDFVDEHIRVRKWDSEEWVEPTVDLLEGL